MKIVRTPGVIGFAPNHTQNWLSKWIKILIESREYKNELTEEQKSFEVVFVKDLIKK